MPASNFHSLREKALRQKARARRVTRISSHDVAVAVAVAVCTISWLWIGTGCRGGIEVRLAEIHALQDAGEFSSSIEPLRDVLAQEPNHPEANQLLGIALVETRQPSLAIWPLRKAAEAEEYAVPAGLLLASTLSQMSSYEEAVRASDGILQIDADNVLALQLRSNANAGAGNFEDALVDADRILELQPENPTGFALRAIALTKLRRNEEAEATLLNLKETADTTGDINAQVRSCVALAAFYREQQLERAEPVLLECLEKHPTQPLVLGEAETLYEELDRPEEATRFRRLAIEKEPDNFNLRSSLASWLVAQREFDEAEALLREAAELFDDVRAWDRIARFYQNREEFEKAREAIGKAMAAAGGASDELRFRQADLLIELGEREQAEQVISELESEVYRSLVQGRLLMVEERYQEALSSLESGIRRWPNNAGARYLAGQAAQQLGQLAKALSHYREAVRAEDTATDAALAASGIFLATGNYADAEAFARRHIIKRRVRVAEALIIAARASSAGGSEEGLKRARAALDDLAKQEGQKLRAAVERAGLERVAVGAAAAVRAIEESGLDLADPENALALRSWVEDQIALGRGEAAEKKVAAILANHPESADVQDIHGRVLFLSGKKQEAKLAFERALAADPQFAGSLGALGRMAAEEQRDEEALELFDRAASADPQETDSLYAAVLVDARLGRSAKVEEMLRALLRRDAGHAEACNDLAWILAEQGKDLDLALDLAQRAARLSPRGEILDTLGWVQLKRGEAAAAVGSFERALELQPAAQSVRYRLGLAQQSLGRSDAALESFRAAVGSGPFPEQEAAREQIARLEAGQQAAR